jgi:cell wall-associated NlpC family hydrolase
VKRRLRVVILVAVTITLSVGMTRATGEQEETLGDKIKKLFVRPTPTPTPRKHRRKASPSVMASPTETPLSSVSPFPEENATAIPSYGETPLTSATPSTSIETLAPVEAKTPKAQYFEPVRPISPAPRSRPRIPRRVNASPEVTPSESPNFEAALSPGETPESRPVPSLPQTVPIPKAQSEGSTQMIPNAQSPTMTLYRSPTPQVPATLSKMPPAKTPASSATAKTAATPVAKKMEEFKPVIPTDQIAESPSYPAQVRKIVDFGLYLAARHLTYEYASADPAKGGMDCSGFIHYVLTQSGIADVPRDAREQYAWIRKAGNFKAVLAQRDDTFELDDLQPGDLLFWASNFGVSRDPEIIQTMIYIGRDKTTNARLMIGASERGTFKGQPKSGVSAFDFKVGRASPKPDNETPAVFVGYGSIPDLSAKESHR